MVVKSEILSYMHVVYEPSLSVPGPTLFYNGYVITWFNLISVMWCAQTSERQDHGQVILGNLVTNEKRLALQ